MNPPDDSSASPQTQGILRGLYLGLGWAAVVLGVIGIPLPGLPTTPFMILAAWAFSRSSPRFHQWLCAHRVFGPYIQRWERSRVIPRHVKIIAISTMLLSLVLLLRRGVPLLVILLLGMGMLGGTIYILRCPSREPLI